VPPGHPSQQSFGARPRLKIDRAGATLR